MPAAAEPSPVLFVDHLGPQVRSAHVEQLISQFGVVERVILLKKKTGPHAKATQYALVQMESLEDAMAAHDAVAARPLRLYGLSIAVSYSKSQELNAARTRSRSRSASSAAKLAAVSDAPSPLNDMARDPNEAVNRILLVTVQNPLYPITTDLIGKIFSIYGIVEKIVIFAKPVGLQCLVQFSFAHDAENAKNKLDGEAIYPESCYMIISYSNLAELVVKENSLKTRDYTNPTLPVPVMDTAINAPHAAMLHSFIPSSVTTAATPSPPTATSHATKSSRTRSTSHSDRSSASADAANTADPIGSPVVLVCNLKRSLTCDQIFNLFSCYGNITRLKKLHAKPDHALIQYATETAAALAITHLRSVVLAGRAMDVRASKHRSISPSPDQDANAKEFNSTYNRFTGKYANFTKHIYSPTRVLHLSNFGASLDDDDLQAHLRALGSLEKAKCKTFTNAKGHPQVLLEFPSTELAINLLSFAHNSIFDGRMLKIAFSRSNVN
ncbi:hypothetical protein SPRG_01987 [Saprolegnia parasitica CBS 223.65]|uniref:RRM domain-containing protein n=1 Tax=Saprolegnia parasitica (strain CBS 223.65) TaxID=695850 RepID=A0A067CVC3_SAPPC|nr:hypothetical protein SPRG_01987 [Saprolegnia parasitica CBS 223.65]KDO33175.1 hypothetical protein SPRG_01987 [Saprolegnia parasitica CBS 223.65]|eukprot:XP_012195938.1 hypothetical protein SPRG_01987 [Saprolegnia parasitica CBS 223.65]